MHLNNAIAAFRSKIDRRKRSSIATTADVGRFTLIIFPTTDRQSKLAIASGDPDLYNGLSFTDQLKLAQMTQTDRGATSSSRGGWTHE